MRYLAIARFRMLTIVRTGTPIFVIAVIPPLLAAMPLSVPEFILRAEAETLLPLNARVAVGSWLLHAIILSFACLLSGKVKSPHDDVTIGIVPDLMDTAPIGPGARFWGETLGTLAATLLIHACCLPLLATVAALNPLPTSVFLWIEAGALALMILASAGAAWQRRAPRTKYSASRGPRNAIVFAILLLLSLFATTRWEAFRDSVFAFHSMRAWAEVVDSVENPLLLFTLLSLLYAAYIAYYYVSATRKRVWEN